MRKLISLCTSLCVTVFLFSASPVQAQSVLWVANNGNDANTCSQTSPCATFQGAINKGSVAQINCLTSGSYGAFTVTASIIIDCGTGNVGNIVSSVLGSTAITINTASPATIILRHLSLTGLGTASNGIFTGSLFSSGTLIVEDCKIQEYGSYGIFFSPSSGRGLLQVSNSQVFGNGYAGILVAPSTGQIATVTLNRVELVGNAGDGLQLEGGIVAGTMRDSVAGGNGKSGVVSLASQVYFTVEESSIIANLASGVYTHSAGALVNVGASTIGGNGTGISAVIGSIISFGNNQMSANGTNGNFTSTTALR
jgi:hypothetical protein